MVDGATDLAPDDLFDIGNAILVRFSERLGEQVLVKIYNDARPNHREFRSQTVLISSEIVAPA